MNIFNKIGEKIMKQTMVQFNGMMANFWCADTAEKRMYCAQANEVNDCALNTLTMIHAAAPTGHEGHVMPMPGKPPASKPANEKVIPKVPPPSPAAKPPAKRADSSLRAE